MKYLSKNNILLLLNLVILGTGVLVLLNANIVSGSQPTDNRILPLATRKSVINYQANTEMELIKTDVVKLQQQLAGLERQGNQTLELLNQLSASIGNNEIPEVEVKEADQKTSDEEVRLQGMINAMEERLNSEGVDKDWADTAIASIENVIANEEDLSGMSILQAFCGSTICSLDLSLNPELSAESNMDRLARHRPWDGQTFFQTFNDQVKIYFAKTGETLPQ